MAIIKTFSFTNFFLWFTALLYLVSSKRCSYPPHQWCDSEEIARQCNVYKQCVQLFGQKRDLQFVPEPFSVASNNQLHVDRIDGVNIISTDNIAKAVDAKAGVQPPKYETVSQTAATPAADLVQVALYYETLCPDSRQFITDMLYPSFLKIGSLMNLTLVPYGHASEKKVEDQWLFTCQHGPSECEGNIIQTCAIDIVKNISAYLPFINCMEGKYGLVIQAAKECALKYKLPYDDILSCSMLPRGNLLEHEMALRTESLIPKLTWVPWITLFGKHTDAIQRQAEKDFVKLICDAYKGPKPPVCS